MNVGANDETGVRKNGSTDNRHPDLRAGLHTFRIVGLDDDEIFEGYAETGASDFYLIGYVTGGATFATNATDKSLAAAGAWTNVDSSVEAPDATYLFFETQQIGGLNMGYREEGSSDNITTDTTTEVVQGIVKCDINQIIEAYEETPASSSSFLIGYTEYGIYPPSPK